MTKEMKNYSTANNSTCTVTSDYESVSILFGLTPKEIHASVIGSYFDQERICSVAIIEMLEKCQEINDEDGDSSCHLSFSKAIPITVELDKANELYLDFISNESEEATLNLHEHMIGIIEKVDKIGGIYSFIDKITCSISEIKTKRAYEDMVLAAFCITFIYIAYERNVLKNQALVCFGKSRKINSKN